MTFLTKKALTRRTMLKGMGASVALPLLDSMMPALSAQSKQAPMRLGFVYAAQAVPQFVYPVIAMLPDRLEVPVRAGIEYMVLMTAPSRDGLRWIEVSDPQVRKADKLPTQ